MPLTNEEFETLFRYFAPPGKRDASDKRVHWRVQTNHPATVVPLLSGKPLEPIVVQVIDASRRGIRFVNSRKFEVGDQFLLCLVSANFKKTRAVLCTIRRCEPAGKAGYRCGCEFIENAQHVLPTRLVMKGLKRFQREAAAAEDRDEAA
jgi:hypothetical protein